MDSTVRIWDLTSKHRMKWGFNPKMYKTKNNNYKKHGTSQTKNGFGLVVGISVTKNTYETRFEEGIFTGIEWDMCTYAADSMKFGFVQIFLGERNTP